jgi:hypothetical protein
MHASLRALLTGLIDYAGLFPPAGLPLGEAIRNYARYRQGADAWMLGRFVCPAGLLPELGRFVPALFDRGPPLSLAVLAGKVERLGDLPAVLRQDMKAIGRFLAEQEGRARADVVEVRLPAGAAADADAFAGALVAAAEVLESAARAEVAAFYEVAPGPSWRHDLAGGLGGLSLSAVVRGARGPVFSRPPGLKLRCGGPDASAIPPPEDVAFALCQCRDHGTALKATAGLHHPFRRAEPGLGAAVHGFVNIFGAAVLAHARRLDEERVRRIIEDEDPAHFVFDEQGFRWQDVAATTAEVMAAREGFATSFGSCSFDEPRDDLRALGWL